MIKPWEEIYRFYVTLEQIYATLEQTEGSRAMAQLVREIELSRYKEGLRAWTSAFDLCIVQMPVTYPYDGPYLKISPVKDGQLEFRYIDTPLEAKQWRRVVAGADGFARLERFLEHLHWFSV